jgi:polyhydroxyalkanoate synthesis regulator phasin
VENKNVKSLRLIAALLASAAIAILPAGAGAQRAPASPEQRIDRLERQVNQMQRQVFPRGRPADTAGFADEPAATQSSVIGLDQRLDALEKQMADILRQSEENGHRLQSLEADIAKARSDQEQRITALEQHLGEAAAAPATVQESLTPETKPATSKPPASKSPATKPVGGPGAATSEATTPATAIEGDPGEEAYTEGFRLWEAGN